MCPDCDELPEPEIVQGCGDEQDGIRSMGTRLKQLELVDDKVFAQARQVAGLGSHFKVMQTALEKVLFGEHGQRRGPATRRGEDCRIEIGTNQPLGGRCLFQLGDHCRPTGRLLPQRAGKAPRLVSRRRLLQSPGGRAIFRPAARAGCWPESFVS